MRSHNTYQQVSLRVGVIGSLLLLASCGGGAGGGGNAMSSVSSVSSSASSSATSSLSSTSSSSSAASSSASSSSAGSSAASRFPLHVESGKRYLLDAQGQPFLITGDAAWSLIAQLTDTQVDQYLADRKAKGFNTLLVNLLEHKFAANAPKDINGTAPFLFKVSGSSAWDFATPNNTYFNRAVSIINKAADAGMLVLLTPAYLGYQGGDEGWYQDMEANGTSKLTTYGTYLAGKFSGCNNIIWVNGGDYDPPDRTVMDAIATTLKTGWLQTFHGGRGTSALNFVNTSELAWLNINTLYTDQSSVPTKASEQYQKSSMPFFLIEGLYEDTQDGGGSEATVRMQAYQAVLSGATGQVMGNWPIWCFGAGCTAASGTTWQNALNSGASRSMQYLRGLLESRAWHTLVPASTDGSLAVASGGAFAFGYQREGASVSVDMSKFTGPKVSVRWYDPTNGAYVTERGSPFANSSTRTFSHSVVNSHGDTDWALLLESTT